MRIVKRLGEHTELSTIDRDSTPHEFSQTNAGFGEERGHGTGVKADASLFIRPPCRYPEEEGRLDGMTDFEMQHSWCTYAQVASSNETWESSQDWSLRP